MKILNDPHFEEPIRLKGAGGATRFVFLRTIGEAIDYVDQALDKEAGPVDLLKLAHTDLHAANDSRKSGDVAKARDTLVAALEPMRVLIRNSITGRA